MNLHGDSLSRRESTLASAPAARKRRARPAAFLGALALGAGALVGVVASAGSTVGASVTPGCGALCVVNSSGTSVSVTGNGSVDVEQTGVTVDSISSAAAVVSGNGTVNAPYVDVTGNYTTSGNGQLTNVSTGVAATPDPLAGVLAGQPLPSGPSHGPVSVGAKTATTIGPGVYSSIAVSSTGQLTLSPGYYVVTGSVNVSGKGSLTGNGVFLYLTCASYPTPCNGAAGPALLISGNGTISISPPDGTCPAISLAVDPTSGSPASFGAAVDLTGNAGVSIGGILYAAGSRMVLSGNGSPVVDAADVGAVGLSGNGNLVVTGDASYTCDSLEFLATNEPTDEVPGTPIAGGAAGDYLGGANPSTAPIEVEATLPGGAVDTGFDGPVTLSIATGFAGQGGNIAGTVTEDAVNGIASFPPYATGGATGISVSATGDYALTATSPGAAAGDSAPFEIYTTFVDCPAAADCAAAAGDGTITGSIQYTNMTGYDELIAITASAQPNWGVGTGYAFGPSSPLWTTIVYGSTAPAGLAGTEDITSTYVVNGHVPPAFVQPQPAGGYQIGYADSEPFPANTSYTTSSFSSGDVTYYTGILNACSAVASNAPCELNDYVNPDEGGAVDFSYLAVGDPTGRDA